MCKNIYNIYNYIVIVFIIDEIRGKVYGIVN